VPKTPLTLSRIESFQKKIYDHYHKHRRALPWRRTRSPYRILVSEIMLQQTQVERVLKKYKEFLAAFPDFSALAQVPFRDVLKIWSGLGYNRRALALQSLAKQVMADHQGKLPSDPEKLIALPGVGKYTAGAVAAFAFNRPVVFMDTNIRRVFINEFFHDHESIRDDEIFPLVEQTLDKKDPRSWYNALMDYGSMLKRGQVNPNRKSAHYVRQKPFENSSRHVRGMILKVLVKKSMLTLAQIVKKTGMDRDRIKSNLTRLYEEGFIRKKRYTFFIKKNAFSS